jgi:hypothetical protein
LDQELSKGEYAYNDANGLIVRKSAHRMVSCLQQLAEMNASHRSYPEAKKNFEVIVIMMIMMMIMMMMIIMTMMITIIEMLMMIIITMMMMFT